MIEQIWTLLSTFVFVEVHRDLNKLVPTVRRTPSRIAAKTERRQLWIETISSEPRIFTIHNLITPEECEHLIQLAQEKGLQVRRELKLAVLTVVEIYDFDSACPHNSLRNAHAG